ncbi:MAG: methyltransferase domain-containing protein [Mycobacteriales bacterium]
MYEPRTYWESLLRQRTGLSGVADPGHTDAALRASYRVVHRNVRRLLRHHGLGSLTGKRVLDIGSGSGYWLTAWQQLGAGDITAVELTDVASDRLRDAFPTVTLVTGDVSEESLEVEGTFDLISAMSVLLHIVDEDAFVRALTRLGAWLSPTGVLLVADPILTRRDSRHTAQVGDNSIARTVGEWRIALDRAGLRLEEVRTSTVLQGNPIDVRGERAAHRLNQAWRRYAKVQASAPRFVARAVIGAVEAADVVLSRGHLLPISAKLAVITKR